VGVGNVAAVHDAGADAGTGGLLGHQDAFRAEIRWTMKLATSPGVASFIVHRISARKAA